MGLPYGENFIILILQPFLYDPPVCRTDRRTDGRALAYTRYSMLSRVKIITYFWSTFDEDKCAKTIFTFSYL